MHKLITPLLAFALTLFASNAIAQNYDARSDQLALNGYDTVAYFTQSDAVEGVAEFSTMLDGKEWHFASAANRDIFLAEPGKYQPQFNGHCAYAAALGAVASIDPTAWTVVDDKLYVNFSHATRDTWSQKRDEYIVAANNNWPNIMPK